MIGARRGVVSLCAGGCGGAKLARDIGWGDGGGGVCCAARVGVGMGGGDIGRVRCFATLASSFSRSVSTSISESSKVKI